MLSGSVSSLNEDCDSESDFSVGSIGSNEVIRPHSDMEMESEV